MVTMIELDIDFEEFFEPENEGGSASSNTSIISDSSKGPISQTVLILYALVTCLLIGVNMIALLISTCILPQLDALSYEDLEIEPLSKILSNQETKSELPRNFFIKKIDTFDTAHFDFPYQKFHKFVETSWICSTVVGTFLFILNVGFIAYIKLNLISKAAAYVGGAKGRKENSQEEVIIEEKLIEESKARLEKANNVVISGVPVQISNDENSMDIQLVSEILSETGIVNPAVKVKRVFRLKKSKKQQEIGNNK
ncbi:Calcium release-activated calcium channel 1 [Brachionus plicatilis]|uniref:Calcium release-activated calcium channel 1 n=1 Tax=Brachionus plicatilis TaxID=10195 RepID=A0A3M7RI82_BRAPC|nr:Calcium release-activated calcium channel 1 [Brachionus plicatilis]